MQYTQKLNERSTPTFNHMTKWPPKHVLLIEIITQQNTWGHKIWIICICCHSAVVSISLLYCMAAWYCHPYRDNCTDIIVMVHQPYRDDHSNNVHTGDCFYTPISRVQFFSRSSWYTTAWQRCIHVYIMCHLYLEFVLSFLLLEIGAMSMNRCIYYL